jgi:hypothetical protein
MQGGGEERKAQAKVNSELPELIADIRQGRYVEAVRLGSAFLASGHMSQPQRAKIQRLLLEAYVALGVDGRATEACEQWLKEDPEANLDPIEMSPKLLKACQRLKP